MITTFRFVFYRCVISKKPIKDGFSLTDLGVVLTVSTEIGILLCYWG
jgi:hypothetical protein